MAILQKNVKPAKVKIMTTLLDVGKAEIGELYYDATNGKLALRTTEGWKYFTKD
jgi:hypothetical protein